MLNVVHLLYPVSNLSLNYVDAEYVSICLNMLTMFQRNVNLSLKRSENGFIFLSLSITQSMGNVIFRQFHISRTTSKNLTVLWILLKTEWIGWSFFNFLFSFDITIWPIFLTLPQRFCHLSKFIEKSIYQPFILEGKRSVDTIFSIPSLKYVSQHNIFSTFLHQNHSIIEVYQ